MYRADVTNCISNAVQQCSGQATLGDVENDLSSNGTYSMKQINLQCLLKEFEEHKPYLRLLLEESWLSSP